MSNRRNYINIYMQRSLVEAVERYSEETVIPKTAILEQLFRCILMHIVEKLSCIMKMAIVANPDLEYNKYRVERGLPAYRGKGVKPLDTEISNTIFATRRTEIPKPDIVLKEFWRKNEHFADLFNAFLFKGQQVLKAEDLKETDTDISGVLKRNGLEKAYQKTLDVVKKTAHGVDFVVLGLENQEKIHYAMPLRILQGDVMLYLQECKDIQKLNGEQNQYSSADEHLSRFKKTDRLHPVITLCVYYGEKDWDGPRCLADMLNIPEGYKALVSDYKMNLLEIRKSDQLLFSDPDVENAFRLVRMIYNRQFAEINQMYQNYEMDPEIGLLVGSVTKTPKIAKQAAAIKAEGGLFNMCTALEELKSEGVQEGIQKGIQEGENRLAHLLEMLSDAGRDYDMRRAMKDEEYRRKLYDEFGIK